MNLRKIGVLFDILLFSVFFMSCASSLSVRTGDVVPVTDAILDSVGGGGEDNYKAFQYYVSSPLTLRKVASYASNALESGQAKSTRTSKQT
jgi:hypothetical protein